ncbi:MAG: acyl-CoA thioesterase [Aestuariibacter sp.]
MTFDEFLHDCQQHKNIADIQLLVPKDWTQGRTAFGGLSAGLLTEVMRKKVDAERLLQSVTFNFVGPLNAEQGFGFEVNILREGKNATQVMAHIIQDGNICLTALASYAKQRQSKVHVPAIHSHALTLPKKPNYIPQIPKITPKFLRHMQLAIEDGKIPFTGAKQSTMSGWMRFKETPASLTDAHIITLIDAWPPTILQMVKGPAPASTMSWNVELIHPYETMSPDEWLAYEAETIYAKDGYAHTEAKIWSQSGQLLAISRQLVAIFD